MDFGVASGVAGFVSLLIQIGSGINKLRDILKNAEQAPAELKQLLRELVFLQHLMEGAKGMSRDPAFEHCEASCSLFVQGLERLYRKLLVDSEKAKGPKMVKTLLAFRHWKKDVEDLLRDIQAAKINLILFVPAYGNPPHNPDLVGLQNSPNSLNSHRTSQCLGEMMLVNQLHTASVQVSVSAASNDSAVSPAPPAVSPRQPPGSVASVTNSLSTASPRPKARGNCLSRSCSCSCHRTKRTSRRFWALEYTPPTVFQQACDIPSCNTAKYGGSFRIALSQLGVRWAAAIQFYVLSESGKFSMRPCLEVERIVPYTSPGFEFIWRYVEGLIDFEAAQKGLVELRRTDPTFPTHVNPGGKSYIEVILGYPSSPRKQFHLHDLFMQQFKMTKGLENPGFLPSCARWIGEGPHMSLLETLIELGFDATVADTQDWPQVSSPGWQYETMTPDPFFVEYITVLCKDNQGFAGLTPLHEAVIFGAPESIRKLAPRYNVNERDFLGQTPLHFAVSYPRHLEVLLEFAPDLDAPDNYGNTPLMYAAAENRAESVMMLLEAGANLVAQESRHNRTFMHYAAMRSHWKLLLEFLERIEALEGKEVAESWARCATLQFHAARPDVLRERDVTLYQFLVKCGDVNFVYDKRDHLGNTLLHDASSISDLDALLDTRFNLINHTNSAGRHPLIAAAARGVPSLVEGLLNAGADIGLKDHWQRTALHHALALLKIRAVNAPWKAMDTVRILVAHGADLLCRDNCRCPCSPEGCLPGVELMHTIDYERWHAIFPVWAIEWVCLVYENKGVNGAKSAVASLLRRAKHEEMDMTHVCCRRRPQPPWDPDPFSHSPSCIPDDDINDILNEESELIEMLENEMTQSADQEYESLLDEWAQHIKSSLAERCKEVAERKAKAKDTPNDGKASKSPVSIFLVDLLTEETGRTLRRLQERLLCVFLEIRHLFGQPCQGDRDLTGELCSLDGAPVSAPASF
ncbi:ankyrin [Colletotrichum falcatum]|nr:ankyrin [Colletotrichum falcatum]